MAEIISIPEQVSSSSVEIFLAQYCGGLGKNFPFNDGAGDITISTNTIWNDAVGYKKVKKLTVNAGITLSINKTPFIILADEIVFGNTSSCIDISGPSGASSGNHPAWCAKGGTVDQSGVRAQAGCGGGMLFIICNKLSGAAGNIKANGGDGWKGATLMSSSYAGCAGNGALSMKNNVQVYGSTSPGDDLSNNGFGRVLGASGTTTNGASGDVSNTSTTGGSGIGAGGSSNSSATQATHMISIKLLFELLLLGCLGGGGGGAHSTTSNIGAGGGGGGAIVVITKQNIVTPTLQANGGTGQTTSGSNNGSAGVTYLVELTG